MEERPSQLRARAESIRRQAEQLHEQADILRREADQKAAQDQPQAYLDVMPCPEGCRDVCARDGRCCQAFLDQGPGLRFYRPLPIVLEANKAADGEASRLPRSAIRGRR